MARRKNDPSDAPELSLGISETYSNAKRDETFQRAFKRYFHELGLHVKRWDELFDTMDNGGNHTVVRRTEDGRIIGFVQFFQYDVLSSYMQYIVCMIHSLWVAPAFRGRGWGARLLRDAEQPLRLSRSAVIPSLTSARYLEHLREKAWEFEEREIPNAEALERLLLRCGYEKSDFTTREYKPVFIKKLK